jgi:hypothetical protein
MGTMTDYASPRWTPLHPLASDALLAGLGRLDHLYPGRQAEAAT